MNPLVRLVRNTAEKKLRAPADHLGRLGEDSFSGFSEFRLFLPLAGHWSRAAVGGMPGHRSPRRPPTRKAQPSPDGWAFLVQSLAGAYFSNVIFARCSLPPARMTK